MRLSQSRSALVVAVLTGAVSASTAACSSDPDGSTLTPEDIEAGLQQKLEADTSVKWKVHVDRRSQEVRFLAPESATPISGQSLEEKARTFFSKYRTELHASDHEQLTVVDEDADTFGHGHVRFQHVLAGTDLPIFDSTSLANFAEDGSLLFVQAGFRRDVANVARIARISREAAEMSALDHVRTACQLAPESTAELKATSLGVWAEEEAAAALAWRVDIRTAIDICVAPRVLVDATTGAVLAKQEMAAFLEDRAGGVRFHHLNEKADVKKLDVSPDWDVLGRKWVLRSETSSPKVRTQSYGWLNINADIETRTLGQWDTRSPAKGAAVDGHYYAGKALEYFKAVHKRNGLDGKGTDLVVVVHDPEKKSSGRNAHYFDYGILFTDDQLHVGDGGGDWMPLSAAFDVMAHELAHGVTAWTSKLKYEKESGALNEAFSDVMGAAAENWLPETRNPKANVLIGERMSKTGSAMRDMADPSGADPRDRDHYKQRLTCPKGQKPDADKNDHCYVHYNSGIANRAFTMMTLGGTHKSSGVAVAKGIRWELARELWYNSFTKLRAEASFYEAALTQSTLAARFGPAALSAVSCAWYAVGVFELPDMFGRNVVCPAESPASTPTPKRQESSCDGISDGIVCNSVAPYSAFVCKNGGIAGGIMCSDLSKRCRKKTPDDWTGTLAKNGTLVCE